MHPTPANRFPTRKFFGAISLCAAALLLPAAKLSADTQTTGPIVETTATPNKNADAQSKEQPSVEPMPNRVRIDLQTGDLETRVTRLLSEMTLDEKIGQMCQVFPNVGDQLTDAIANDIRQGRVGSIFYAGSTELVQEAQQIASQESRLGIPLIIGRDVIHGFRTTFPIPLGQAASWNPELVRQAAEVAAAEAKGQGVNWTFAPMVDICRDPRWGRIAETLGEDPMLSGVLASAMVEGFQQTDEQGIQGVVACAKHYAAYGLSEGGRDYNRASLSRIDLHNIHLPPFRAVQDAGCQTMMTTFSEVNGVPGTAHDYLLKRVLKGQWGFQGFVVSDWASVTEMVEHGYSEDEKHAAQRAANAGVDMEMVSTSYNDNLAKLCREGHVPESAIDDAVRRILRVKLQIASTHSKPDEAQATLLRPSNLEAARKLARQSMVLLKNQEQTLPLELNSISKIAVVGPLADAPQSQLGCWVLDAKQGDTITPLAAIQQAFADRAEVLHAPGADSSFSQKSSQIAKAASTAAEADVVVVVIGEDATLSGEARSRSKLCLPGVQDELLEAVAASGKPIVTVVIAGRPLAIGKAVELSDAVLYAWHPGTMGGPALVDLLLGREAPSGRLPVTFPKSVGQVPLYYGHSNTGRPSPHNFRPLIGSEEKDLPMEFQYRSHYVDQEPFPLFPFGYGLSYTTFAYEDLELGAPAISPKQTLSVRVRVKNTGEHAGAEVVQLYLRDQYSTIIRPVRELKAFRRVFLKPGETKVVEFALTIDDIATRDADGELLIEPGVFQLWAGGDCTASLTKEFKLLGGKPDTTADASSPTPAPSQTASPAG